MAQAEIPVLSNVTADSWARLMSAKPNGLTPTEWSSVALTVAELSAGRTMPSARIKRVEVLAKKGNLSDKQKSFLSDAETTALENESTATGRAQIANQPPLRFASASQLQRTAAVAQAPTPRSAAPAARPAPVKQAVAQADDSEVPGSRVVRQAPPPRPAPAGRQQPMASTAPTATVTHRPIPQNERYMDQMAPAPSAVASKPPTPPHAPVATAAPAAPPSHTVPKILLPSGISPTEKAAYTHLLASVKGGRATKEYTYGKLNWGYEMASRAGDEQSKTAIAADMRRIRRFAPGPGRYGVSDKEYKNYSYVEQSLCDATMRQPTPPELSMAYKTAKKYGHETTMDVIAERMPSLARDTAVAAKTSPSMKTAAVATAATAAVATGAVVASKSSLGPAPAGIPAEDWKSSPPKPANIDMPYWRSYVAVNYFLTEKGVIPSVTDLNTAASVATQRGDTKGVQIYTALAKGANASVPELANARMLALKAKTPQHKTANLIGDRLIMNASQFGSPQDLKTAETVAREMGKTQTASALHQRLATMSPVLAAPPVLAAAALSTAQLPRVSVATQQIPPSPAVVATVPATPPPKIVAQAAQATGVPAPVVAKIIIEAKANNPEAREMVERGASIAQAAARKDPDARAQIEEWQREAPSNPTAQRELAGVAAANAITTAAPRRSYAPVAIEEQADDSPPPPPPRSIATVSSTPSPAMVEVAAAGAGVAAGSVAAAVLAAKHGDKRAQQEMHEGAVLASDLEDKKPEAHEHLANLQTAAKGGDKNAQGKLIGVAAAVATSKAISAESVEAPEASVAGSGGGGGVAAAIVGVLLGAIMIGAMAKSKGGKSAKTGT